MADEFSFTDSDDERAVEDVLSQALDHSVLEQIAAINCSSFSTKDNLPFDLENRFRKLKSLPTATGSRLPISKSKSFTPRSGDGLSLNQRHNNGDFERVPDLKKCSEKSSPVTDDDPEQLSDEKKGQKLSTRSRTGSSESSPSSENPEQLSEGNREEKKGTNSRSKQKSSSSSKTKSLKSKSKSSEWGSDSWSVSSSESRSVSPPQRGIGCLWCSPKKDKRRQGKENRSSSWGNGYEYDDEFFKTFSVKEQKKIMRQAMKEEEKINKEAEKIVKWAKQASSRMMDVSGVVDDELSDVEK